MTIYELTKEERATMKKLVDNGLVVSIGKHAGVKKRLAVAVSTLQSLADAYRKHGVERDATALESVIAECRA